MQWECTPCLSNNRAVASIYHEKGQPGSHLFLDEARTFPSKGLEMVAQRISIKKDVKVIVVFGQVMFKSV
jgi:hypothetical protein